MTIHRFLPSMLITTVLVALFSVSAAAQSQVKHVLLISVDGLHALDVADHVSQEPEVRIG